MEANLTVLNETGKVIDTDFDAAKRGLYSILSFLIISLNLCVIKLSFSDELKEKEFKYYFINLSCIEITYGVCLLLFTVFEQTVRSCEVGGLLLIILGCCAMQGPLPIFVSRYVAICKPQSFESIPKLARILPLCLYPLLVNAPQLIFYLLDDVSFGSDIYGVMCGISDSKTMYNVYVPLTLLFLYVVICFCQIKIRREMKEMYRLQQDLLMMDKIRETRFLLRAALLQAISPIALQVPYVLMTLVGPPDPSQATPSPGQKWAYLATGAMLDLNSILDPLSTLLVVKPYRMAAIKGFHRIRGKKGETADVERWMPMGESLEPRWADHRSDEARRMSQAVGMNYACDDE